ncbi:amidohydrolase family protein [Fusobacterium sp. PH5-44]|uniref:amidohydrolase family protein n=1 Tax=unclassified Fusobacterium TaxID=2648384 RepID=UPI003D1CBA57
MEKDKIFALKGNILFSKNRNTIVTYENSFIICKNGKVDGVYSNIPEELRNIEIIDCSNKFIIPGLIDLHIHAPQYAYRGTQMDLELLNWLDNVTFPQESKYKDVTYAQNAYKIFAEDLKNSFTTRACIYGTIHVEATTILMDYLEESGLITMVGKVNMDRNSISDLIEQSPKESYENTKKWIENSKNKYKNTFPIITPRFTPACSDELMSLIGKLQRETTTPVQSHLSENISEISLVKELCHDIINYSDSYAKHGLFGGNVPTIMAHCVYLENEEIDLIKENEVFIAHCPNSNMNLSSGIAPARKYLDKNIKIGLGSDIAGGVSISIFKAITDAIQVSKLRWRLVDESLKPITFEESFYMATKGGGEFFGKVGTFEKGYDFDVLVLDDSNIKSSMNGELSLRDRLERIAYIGEKDILKGKYVKGIKIL